MTEPVEVVMRTVQPGDYGGLVRFFDANNVAQVVRQFHPFPLTATTAQYITRTKHLDRYYVALFSDQIVALCMLRGWDEGYLTPSFGILVDHRFHNRGIGTRVTEFAISEAEALGCHQVRLSVYASNRAALRLYERMGFVEHTRESVVVAGESDEKIIMLNNLQGQHG